MTRSLPPRTAAAVLCALLAPAIAAAQAGKAPDPNITKLVGILNADNAPGGADRTWLVKWVQAKTQEMWTIDSSKSVALLKALREDIMPVTPKNAKAFGPVYQEAFLPYLARKASHPGAALQVAHVMSPLADNGIFEAYRKIASVPGSAGARYVAWRTLHGMRNDFGQNAADRKFMTDRLAAEDSAAVVAEIFNVIDVSAGAFAAAKTQTLVGVLDGLRARNKRYFDGDMSGVGGEVRAMEILIALCKEPTFNPKIKQEAIEAVFRLQYVCAVRYTQFDQETVDLMRMNQKSPRELRQGLAEAIIHSDRALVQILSDVRPTSAINVEDAFANLVREPARFGNTNVFPDAIDALDVEIVSLSTIHSVRRYLNLLKALEDRKTHIKEVLKTNYEAKLDPAEPGPWKLAK